MTAETSAPEFSSDAPTVSALDALIRRARSLYTLPAVAAEVIQLTSNPHVDALVLKECIQTDPALTAKILRVVNSSLFGLSGEVSDLNQALALLGTKPLKLLVLGFSLPETLFREVAREQLDWYWSTTLTRAVAARAISEKLYKRPGDDAFLVGLLQGIGVLVLLGQLQEPYARFLSHVIHGRVDLQRVEVESLGFDHLALTAALLRDWQMPELFVRAIAAPRAAGTLVKPNVPHSELARILHLADLLAELVGRKRLDVLPDLLEVGSAYCGIDRESLNDLVAYLQPQVNQLAEVLSLELPGEMDYAAVMSEAHSQMSQLAESVAEPLSRARRDEEQAVADVLSDTTQLRSAVDSFLDRPATVIAPTDSPAIETLPAAPSSAATAGAAAAPPDLQSEHDLSRTLTLTVGQCRSKRQPISLVLLGAVGGSAQEARGQQVIRQLFDAATLIDEVADLVVLKPSPCRSALLLPNFDRQEAVRIAQQVIDRLQTMTERLEASGTALDCLMGAGVASVTLPPKNFPPQDLLETAQRCLSAAQVGGSFGMKSLEIY